MRSGPPETSPEYSQRSVCERLSAHYVATFGSDKLGVADNLRSGLLPINGLRHPPVGNTSGWYIWAGTELPDDPDFFQPLHADHISE